MQPQHRDRIVQQRVDPLVGREAADREDEAAEILRRVEAGPVADPRTVREGRHHEVGLAHAEGVERARVGMIEAVPVVARVEERERPAGRGRGHVDARARRRAATARTSPHGGFSAWFSFSSSLVVKGSFARSSSVRIGGRLDPGGLELAPVERAVRRRVGQLLAQAPRSAPASSRRVTHAPDAARDSGRAFGARSGGRQQLAHPVEELIGHHLRHAAEHALADAGDEAADLDVRAVRDARAALDVRSA